MSVINSIPLIAAGDDGYQISRSVRLRSSASAYFNRTPASAGNRQVMTFSWWMKRGALGTYQDVFCAGTDANNFTEIRFNNDDTLSFGQALSGGTDAFVYPSMVFRDSSAWYHVIYAIDSTQATAADRAKIYVNGVQQTLVQSVSIPLNRNFFFDATNSHMIGNWTAGSRYFDGYITEINFIDGQALTPSSFGETDVVTGVWKPKRYAGTYGTNGFYLNFSDNSAATAAAIGKDWSGNGNNWTPNNISVTAGATYDSMLDVPTPYADGGNGRGNYAVLNTVNLGSGTTTLSEANLKATFTNTAYAVGTFGASSGKWYAEAVSGGSVSINIGCVLLSARTNNASSVGLTVGVLYQLNGQVYINGSLAATISSYTTGDVIGIALNLDSNQVTFYKNNVAQTPVSITAGEWTFCVATSYQQNATINFGQRPFAYTPPTGFKALNTQNLPDATIKKGNAYFDATTYTGTGSARSVTGLGFQPDLVWVKGRSVAYSHLLTDSVRGVSKRLVSDSTAAEVTDTDTLTAFNSDGFSWGTGIGGNQNAATYVAWQWKESASAGFDIVTCTTNGSGIITSTSHSLGVTPSMIILKARTGTDAWYVYHKNSTTTATQGTLQLNATSAVNTTNGSSGGVDKWTVSSSAFAAGNAAWSYQVSTTHIAYLFAEVAGYSKFGSYTGNGSTDGPFVYCGFRPRWVMIKRTDVNGASWWIQDTSRSTYNAANAILFPNLSNAEYTMAGVELDVLSNGFKWRTSNVDGNASGGTYIYAAFAESPFKNSLAR